MKIAAVNTVWTVRKVIPCECTGSTHLHHPARGHGQVSDEALVVIRALSWMGRERGGEGGRGVRDGWMKRREGRDVRTRGRE